VQLGKSVTFQRDKRSAEGSQGKDGSLSVFASVPTPAAGHGDLAARLAEHESRLANIQIAVGGLDSRLMAQGILRIPLGAKRCRWLQSRWCPGAFSEVLPARFSLVPSKSALLADSTFPIEKKL
jgi:hypothetical protein